MGNFTSQSIKSTPLELNAANIRDEVILERFNQGDTDQAFRLLMKKYQERLYWHIRRIVIDHADANDVIQNTLVKVYKNLDGFKGNSALYTWLYRIATNESITFMKRKKRRSGLSIDDEELGLEARLKADTYFDADDAQTKLVAIIEELSEKQRLVFKLRYYEEMTYKDMSQVLDTSEGALKASYHHAAKKIEASLRALATS